MCDPILCTDEHVYVCAWLFLITVRVRSHCPLHPAHTTSPEPSGPSLSTCIPQGEERTGIPVAFGSHPALNSPTFSFVFSPSIQPIVTSGLRALDYCVVLLENGPSIFFDSVHALSGLIFLWDVIHSGLIPYGELDPAPLSPISCRSQCLVITHGPAQGQDCLLNPVVIRICCPIVACPQKSPHAHIVI